MKEQEAARRTSGPKASLSPAAKRRRHEVHREVVSLSEEPKQCMHGQEKYNPIACTVGTLTHLERVLVTEYALLYVKLSSSAHPVLVSCSWRSDAVLKKGETYLLVSENSVTKFLHFQGSWETRIQFNASSCRRRKTEEAYFYDSAPPPPPEPMFILKDVLCCSEPIQVTMLARRRQALALSNPLPHDRSN